MDLPGTIRDADCTKDTPVRLGLPREPVYGLGVPIEPCLPGKQVTAHDRAVYLPRLLPLEDYDLIIVLFSGGKDSLAAYEVLRELGVPKEKIELWHHDIDGGHPERRMDWPVTAAYVQAFAEAEGVALRRSWRQNGFFGELYRLGASWPVQYDAGQDVVRTCPLSEKQRRSQELREKVLSARDRAELERYGRREKFPAKSGDLARRWCSAYLKIMVSDSVLRNLAPGAPTCGSALMAEVQGNLSAHLAHGPAGIRILVVSGERRGESAGRAKYNEMEFHRAHAMKKARRTVHAWRPVIDCHEGDVWAILRRHHINPHPCYQAGWNRCSCMACIFSRPEHWAGLRELFPAEFEALCEDERRLGFTLDNKVDLSAFTGSAKSCVCHDPVAIRQLQTGRFTPEDVYTSPGAWKFPAGAFHGSEGGPC